MKRFVLIVVVLLSMVILGATASADVRTSGPGPLRTVDGWTTN